MKTRNVHRTGGVRMKVVIAIDSLKGSLTSMEAGSAIKQGIRNVSKEAEVFISPLADGGEGTTDALIEGMGGEKIFLTVTGPDKKPVKGYYGYLKEQKMAIIEMAMAAGITYLKEEERSPYTTTTYGVGEMISHAIEMGSRKFVIGIGGSATNDGGTGMLEALGYEFYDKNGQVMHPTGGILDEIGEIRSDKVIPALRECEFRIACDVENPLYGKTGASYIYGPQKGATIKDCEILDQKMRKYAEIVKTLTGHSHENVKGAGAAGGLGFAFLSFLSARLEPGIELILDTTQLEKRLIDADYVITGEGRLDGQTAMGKAPIGVAQLAKKYGKKVIAFAGSITHDAKACHDGGIDAFFPIVRGVCTLEEAMNTENAKRNLQDTVEEVFRLLV